ncbi:MAG TPA: hypothetical protein VF076_07260 [Acidimicrobiales bacterium]
MAWFASPDDRRADPRTVNLAASLGVNRHEALGVIDCLYGWTAAHAPSGDLAPYSDAAIALACDWSGPAETLVTALLEAGVLTSDAFVADWDGIYGPSVERRAYKAQHERGRRGSAAVPAVDTAVDSPWTPRGLAVDMPAPSPPLPRTPETPPTGAAPSEPPGDTGRSTPGRSSGPEPGARARAKPAQVAAVPKPSPGQVRLARVVDLVREAGVEIFPSARDGAAVKSCGAPADRVAEAYIAAARGEWDPGGDGWLGDSLSVHLVISRLAGYRPKRGGDFLETRYGRLRPPGRDPVDDGAVAF